MDFMKTAAELEKNIIQLFQQLRGDCTSHQGIQHILEMLLEDQKKHLAFFSAEKGEACPTPGKSRSFSKTRELFEDIQKKKNTFSCEIDQLKLYREVRDLVSKKHHLYAEMAEKEVCPTDRKTLQQIAEEERKQTAVLDHIIQMVSRPDTWIEDAEFNHLEDY